MPASTHQVLLALGIAGMATTSSYSVNQATPCPRWPPFNVTMPVFWFGGPIPESPSALGEIARYSAAVMSSQGNASVVQCARLKKLAPSAVCLTYRQTAVAWPHDPPFATAVPDPAHSGWWIQESNGSRWLEPSYFWDWRNKSLQEWYVSSATEALTLEAPEVDGAFFDDFDGAVCPFESAFDRLPAHYTQEDRLEMHSAKMHTMGAVARRLCAANQRAIFAMAATFSRDAAPPAYQCEVNESASIDAIGVSTPFVRYRIWPRTAQLSADPARCTVLMNEMLREQSMGIDSFFYTIVEDGEVLSNVSVAAFLLSRGPRSMFGASSGWVDADWRWHEQYDLRLGVPASSAVAHGDGVFTREYTSGSVFLDCVTGVVNITAKAA